MRADRAADEPTAGEGRFWPSLAFAGLAGNTPSFFALNYLAMSAV